jgi:hypothetical protein
MEQEVQMEAPRAPGDNGGTPAAIPAAPAATPGVSSQTMSTLSIKGAGLTFDQQIPQGMVLKIMHLVLTGDAADSSRGGAGAEGARGADSYGGDGRPESLAEMYRRAGPKKYPEKLVTIAMFIHKVLDRASFTPDDLRAQFRAVNEPPPANMPRDFRLAVGEGWIAEEHDQPGQFYITKTGMDVVEAGFSAEGRKAGKSRKRKRVAKTPAEPGEDGE